MTTDELVKKFIAQIMDDGTYDEKYARTVYSVDGQDVFSLALNDETRDVRYVKVDYRDADVVAFEVKPVTVLRTEYRRV